MSKLFDNKLNLGKDHGVFSAKDASSVCILCIEKIKTYRITEDAEKGYTTHFVEFQEGGRALFVFKDQEFVSASLDDSVERRISDEKPPRLVIL